MLKGSIFDNRFGETLHSISYSKKIINNDTDAYNYFKEYNYVYDKLWVAKTQNLKCGKMNETPEEFPVFIKPIIGLKGGNRECYKIDNIKQFNEYVNKDYLFWTEYIDKGEGSSDFIIENGKILFEMHYLIENEKNGFLQTVTKLSPHNNCPQRVRSWLLSNLGNYRGIVNLQYRGDYIIECGLRFDSGGNFIQFTGNKNIIKNINNFFDEGKWNQLSREDLYFEDRYIYKCSCPLPIIYYIPAPIIVLLMRLFNIRYYGFYIDETKNKMSFLNIVDSNIQKLENLKFMFEKTMLILNWIFIIGFIIFSVLFLSITKFKKRQKYTIKVSFIIFIVLYLTRFINPPKYLRRII
jgi:hypothetical protein